MESIEKVRAELLPILIGTSKNKPLLCKDLCLEVSGMSSLDCAWVESMYSENGKVYLNIEGMPSPSELSSLIDEELSSLSENICFLRVKTTVPFAADFYSIVEQDGEKYIHVNGYTYSKDKDDWECVEVCWFVFKLSDFIKSYKENPDYVDEVYQELNQYQDDGFSDSAVVTTINEYFDGHGADAYLSFGSLTEDTPPGNYINLN